MLAEQLLINPNTVARAYRELEAAGVVTMPQGAGTYVSDAGSPLALRFAEPPAGQPALAGALWFEGHGRD